MSAPTGYSQDVVASAHALMRDILKLKSTTFVDGTKITTLANQLGIRNLEARIYFLRELHGLVRKLPLKIYGDDKDRERLMSAVQDALDRAIDEEDEAE